MGLSDLLKKATGDKDARMKGFNRRQVEQLLMAEKDGLEKTECFNHKEWGPTLMNVCWNREKEGKDIAAVYLVADWLRNNFDLNEDGTLFDDVDIVLYAYERFENGAGSVPVFKKDDGPFDKTWFMFKALENKTFAYGGDRLLSGRAKIQGDMNVFDIDVLMAEGIPEVKSLISSLERIASNDATKDKQAVKSDDMFARMADRQWSMLSLMLAFDDMNIRGYQFLYALEYTDGSVEKLYELARGSRSHEMVDYINMKSAKDYLAGNKEHNQLAVSSGASGQYPGGHSMMWGDPIELTLSPLNIDKYAELNSSKLEVDYSSLDVVDGVDLAAAIRICEAHGFKLVTKVQRKGKFDDDLYSIVMYNPDTRDYVAASSAQQSSVCYGGVELVCHRVIPQEARRELFCLHCSEGNIRGNEGRYFVFTHNEGLFSNYDKLAPYVPTTDFDWFAIGFGYQKIPVPKYFELPFIRDAEMGEKLGAEAASIMRDMGAFHFENMVNAFLMAYDENLCRPDCPTQHYGLAKEWVMHNCLCDCAGWFTGGSYDSCAVASLVFTYLKVPDDIVEEIKENTRQHFVERDENKQKNGWREESDEKAFVKCAQKLSNNSKHAEAVIGGFGLVSPEELPIKLPWLQS